MSDPWQSEGESSPEQPRRLDRRSRGALAAFLLRLCGVSAIALWPYLAGARPLQESAGALAGVCAIGGAVSAIWAVLGRETIGRGSLNRWDEALAFAALSRLAHFAHGVHA